MPEQVPQKVDCAAHNRAHAQRRHRHRPGRRRDPLGAPARRSFRDLLPELDGDQFWISELTIEVHHYQDETILGFNGTTEWALDSVPLDKAIWLPREDQLRTLIGDRLESLQRTPDGWTVTYRTDTTGGGAGSVTHTDPEEAYAAALLDIAGAFTPSE